MGGEYELLKALLSDRIIAFHPRLARVLGGVYEALLFQQLAYWSDKGDDPEWIYKTRDDLREETTLNRYQQEQARKSLRNLGVIEEERRGIPAKLYYRVVWDRVFELLEESRPVGRRSTDLTVDTNRPAGSPSADKMAEGVPTSKSTAEKTTEGPETFEFRKPNRIMSIEERIAAETEWNDLRERIRRLEAGDKR